MKVAVKGCRDGSKNLGARLSHIYRANAEQLKTTMQIKWWNPFKMLIPKTRLVVCNISTL